MPNQEPTRPVSSQQVLAQPTTPEPKSSGIPALVVSGFLGAGKTTLVSALLKDAQRQGLRLAVVSNEFGELGIDQALLSQNGGEGYVELKGGCVCCQLSNELLATLQDLWERVQPDRVIVETSGVALPFETLVTFWREPVSRWVEESLAVVVVNAEQLREQRDLEGTFEQQVSSADIVLLNKIDLISPSRIGELEATLKEIAPGTPIIHSMNAQMDPLLLFPPEPSTIPKRADRTSFNSMPHTHEAFEAQNMMIEDGVDSDTLIHRLKNFHALRIKGVVRTSQGLRLVQGVGSRIDLVPPPLDLPTTFIGKVVLIQRQSISHSSQEETPAVFSNP